MRTTTETLLSICLASPEDSLGWLALADAAEEAGERTDAACLRWLGEFPPSVDNSERSVCARIDDWCLPEGVQRMLPKPIVGRDIQDRSPVPDRVCDGLWCSLETLVRDLRAAFRLANVTEIE